MNEEIYLTREEYSEVDDGVKALVKTIVEKLPTPTRRKYQPLVWQRECQKKEAELMQAGVDSAFLLAWLDLNASATQRGRSAQKVYQILSDILRLSITHSVAEINLALSKVCGMAEPQKATVAYLKAILRNGVTPRQAQRSPKDTGAPHPRRQTASAESVPVGRTDEEIWGQMLNYIRQRLDARAYVTWIQHSTLISMESGRLVIGVFDEDTVAWLNEYYTGLFLAAYRAVTGQTDTARLSLEFRIVD